MSGVVRLETRSRRFTPELLAIAAAALVAALPVGAKEGVKATLTTTIPLEAPAGTEVRVTWRLFSVDEDGRRQPFGASGVFVRLVSGAGAGAKEAFASTRSHRAGEYEATVLVPEGGIGDVEIGLMGWRSDATGTRRSDMLFPITNEGARGVGHVASPAAGHPRSERPGTSRATSAFTVVVVLSTVAVLAAARVFR